MAEIIRARRVVRGMERQDLAAAVGCDVRTVRRWESGSPPFTHQLPAMGKAFDIPREGMNRIMQSLLPDLDGGLQIEGSASLGDCGLAHGWLADVQLAIIRVARLEVGTTTSQRVHCR